MAYPGPRKMRDRSRRQVRRTCVAFRFCARSLFRRFPGCRRAAVRGNPGRSRASLPSRDSDKHYDEADESSDLSRVLQWALIENSCQTLYQIVYGLVRTGSLAWSLRAQIEILDHLRPARKLRRDMCSELFGRTRADVRAFAGKAFGHARSRHGLADIAVERCNNGRRRRARR